MAGLAAQQPAPVDFAREVVPILARHCLECHGADKQKGDLRLDARAFVFPAADADVRPIVTGEPDASELIRRVGLPSDDDDRMPPEGPPLPETDRDLLRRWVAAGAPWPADGDAAVVAALAAVRTAPVPFDLPVVTAAERAAIDAAVAEWRGKGAAVEPVGRDALALAVNLAPLRAKVGDAEVARLRPLAPVLVWLDLSRTAVTDAVAADLGELRQLRRLHVADTKLGPSAFPRLAALPHLELLNAHGTGLDDETLLAFAGSKSLRQVYAWRTAVTAAGQRAVAAKSRAIRVDAGEDAEQRFARAHAAVAAAKSGDPIANTVCPVSGEAVDAAQSLVHDGRRIAFCCATCKARFARDPAPFLAKLPPAEASGPAVK